MIKRLLTIFCILLLCCSVLFGSATAFAEEGEPKKVISVERISAKSSLTLGVAEKVTLSVTVSPKNATEQLKYQSSNKSIVTVSQKGVITPKRQGEAIVSIYTDSGVKKDVSIIVKPAPTSLSYSCKTKTVNIGDSFRFRAKRSKDSAGQITYKSSDETIATITQKGEVVALKSGQVTITAKTYNGKKAKATITVLPNAKKIKIKNSLTLLKGKKSTLSVTYAPKNSNEEIIWTSSNKKVATVSKNGVVSAKAQGKATITATTKNSKKTAKCTVVVKNKLKMIALTFDDGPHKTNTKKLLDYLKKKGHHATFFVVGNRMAANKDLILRMKKEGHEIGYHSWDHTSLLRLSNNEIKKQIKKGTSVLKSITGDTSFSLLRPPYGSLNDRTRIAINMPAVLWSVDPLDWKYRNKSYVKNQVVKGAKDGAIILLHDIHATSVDAAIAAIEELSKKGYQFVTVSELLESNGETPQIGKKYYKITR